MTTLKYWTTTSSPTPAATQVGSLKSSTDPRNKTSSLEYDADGNLAKLTSPLGLKSTMVYDGSGRLTSQRDPRGNVPVPASGYLTALTYDAVDHVATTTDARGAVTSFDYYDNELLWKTTVTDRSSVSRVTTLKYDSDNRLWKTTDPRAGVETRNYWPDRTTRVYGKRHEKRPRARLRHGRATGDAREPTETRAAPRPRITPGHTATTTPATKRPPPTPTGHA